MRSVRRSPLTVALAAAGGIAAAAALTGCGSAQAVSPAELGQVPTLPGLPSASAAPMGAALTVALDGPVECTAGDAVDTCTFSVRYTDIGDDGLTVDAATTRATVDDGSTTTPDLTTGSSTLTLQPQGASTLAWSAHVPTGTKVTGASLVYAGSTLTTPGSTATVSPSASPTPSASPSTSKPKPPKKSASPTPTPARTTAAYIAPYVPPYVPPRRITPVKPPASGSIG